MKLHFIAPALIAILTSAPAALAEPPLSSSRVGGPSPLDGAPEPDVKTVSRWYGWQIMLGTGPSHALIAAGFIAASSSGGDGFYPGTYLPVGFGLAGHVLSGPIVHWAHGHVARGFGSLALNILVPGVGMGLGAGFGQAADRPDIGFIAGALVGCVVAPAMDIAVLAHEEVPAGSMEDERPAWARSLTIAPFYGRDGAGLSVAGIF